MKYLKFISAIFLLYINFQEKVQSATPKENRSGPSIVRIVSFKNPLEEEAYNFVKAWTSRSTEEFAARKEDTSFQSFSDFVDYIITTDMVVGNYKDLSNLQFRNFAELSYDSIGDSNTNGIKFNSLTPFIDSWLEEHNLYSNAFACYILGYLEVENINFNNVLSHKVKVIKNYLEIASQKHYIRAIDFLLANPQWQQDQIDRPQLLHRMNVIKKPAIALERYIQTLSHNGQPDWEEIREFENGLKYSISSMDDKKCKEYFTSYRQLAADLTEALCYRKQPALSPKVAKFIAGASAFAASATAISFGVTNVKQGLLPNDSLSQEHVASGIVQLIGGSIGATGILLYSFPYFSFQDLLYRFQEKSFHLTMLPAFYSDDDIAKQAHLIALKTFFMKKDEIVKESQEFFMKKILRRAVGFSYKDRLKRSTLKSFNIETNILSCISLQDKL